MTNDKMLTRRTNTPAPAAVVDREAGTVTFAVTVRWEPSWVLDTCEVVTLARAVADGIADNVRVAEVISVLTSDPDSKRLIAHWRPRRRKAGHASA